MDLYTWAIVGHVVGTVIGVGTVTMHDFQFWRAIGDREMAAAYRKSAQLYSRIIQGGLGLLILSGAYFMISRPVLWGSEKILTKLALVALLFVNGYVISVVLHKRFDRLSIEDWVQKTPALKRLVQQSVPFHAVSVSAWYATLFLGAVGRQPWSALEIVMGYGIVFLLCYLVLRFVFSQRLKK